MLYFFRLFNYFNLNVNSKYIIILFNNSINNYFVCFYIFIIKSMQNRRFFNFNFYFFKNLFKAFTAAKKRGQSRKQSSTDFGVNNWKRGQQTEISEEDDNLLIINDDPNSRLNERIRL